MKIPVLTPLQYPVDDRRCDKQGDDNLAGVEIDEQCGQDTDQYDDKGDQPNLLIDSHIESAYVVSNRNTSMGECLKICRLPLQPIRTDDRITRIEMTSKVSMSGANARSK